MQTFEAAEVVPSAARTTTGNGNAFTVEDARQVAVLLDITAVSGTTPSMTVSMEWSHDGGTTWAAVDPSGTDTFTAQTATGRRVRQVAVKAPLARLAWAITGTTPSFTFKATAYAT